MKKFMILFITSIFVQSSLFPMMDKPSLSKDGAGSQKIEMCKHCKEMMAKMMKHKKTDQPKKETNQPE